MITIHFSIMGEEVYSLTSPCVPRAGEVVNIDDDHGWCVVTSVRWTVREREYQAPELVAWIDMGRAW